ncbi:MAG: response regulator transcription factor [Oligoflexia bacterium]|nr:response regulator transcription factor [Oligoflexia bacterium]
MKKVLLIEDSKEVFQMVKQGLAGLTELDWVTSIESATHDIQKKSYSLILLDLELPDGNGIDLCTKLQELNPNLPIFILTANSDISNKVLGFSAGAEDYITKPFEILELRARVEAKLRKAEILSETSDLLKWTELEIDKKRQEVKINNGNEFEKIDLTALEFKLLLYFASQPGVVISRDDVLNTIWGENVHVYSRSVDTHVSKLRKKLKNHSTVIESVHGSGYKFNVTKALL